MDAESTDTPHLAVNLNTGSRARGFWESEHDPNQ